MHTVISSFSEGHLLAIFKEHILQLGNKQTKNIILEPKINMSKSIKLTETKKRKIQDNCNSITHMIQDLYCPPSFLAARQKGKHSVNQECTEDPRICLVLGI